MKIIAFFTFLIIFQFKGISQDPINPEPEKTTLQLTSITKTKYIRYNKEDYEFCDRPVTLNGKCYFITMNGLDKAMKKKQPSYLNPQINFTLYETNGTAEATKKINETTEGIFNLTASKNNLLYFSYTSLYGNLYRYNPNQGLSKHPGPYKLNARLISSDRVTKIFTYPDRDEAVMMHFENDIYKVIHIDKEGKCETIYTYPYVEASKLTDLPINITQRPILNDTAIFSIGNELVQKKSGNSDQKNSKWITKYSMISLNNKNKIKNYDYSKLENIQRTLIGTAFWHKGTAAILNYKNGSGSMSDILGISLVNSNNKMAFYDIKKDIDGSKFLKTFEDNNGNLFVAFKNFMGFIKLKGDAGTLSWLNLNYGKGLTYDFKFTDDYLFFSQLDTVFYQHKDTFIRNNNIPKIILSNQRRIIFTDQFNYLNTATTKKYLYYVNKDNTLMRFDPQTEKTVQIQLPPKVTIIEWRMFQSSANILLIGGITKGNKKTEYYEVFAIKDN